jgi:hypothetical protein
VPCTNAVVSLLCTNLMACFGKPIHVLYCKNIFKCCSVYVLQVTLNDVLLICEVYLSVVLSHSQHFNFNFFERDLKLEIGYVIVYVLGYVIVYVFGYFIYFVTDTIAVM